MVLQNKNEESTFYQDEGRFSYYEGHPYIDVDESALSPRSNQYMSSDELPVFIFPEYRNDPMPYMEEMMNSQIPDSIFAENDNDSEIVITPPIQVVDSKIPVSPQKMIITPQSS